MDMIEDLVKTGIKTDELLLAKNYLKGKMKMKSVFPLVARDFQKMMIGLGASVAIVLTIHYILIPNGL